MEPCMQRALMFVGAVIGAGFASGREIFSFFSCYGAFSWFLILVATGTMAILCWLCLRRAGNKGVCGWCEMYCRTSPFVKNFAECSILLLQVIMGGSMISAAGHIAALALPFSAAYPLGMLVTIALALWLGSVGMKPMTALGSLLAVLFVGAIMAVLVFDAADTKAVVLTVVTLEKGIAGSIRAVAYASLNLAISIGMICRCGNTSCKVSSRSAVLFGLVMTGLLFVSNYLYLHHPELVHTTFPMVALLGRFGKAGHNLSLLVMYLAILTTLSAGLFALRTGLETKVSSKTAWILTILLPLGLSHTGFENLVDRWYAPVGILCLLLVFVPLLQKHKQSVKISLDN